jgi:hypothetical protein
MSAADEIELFRQYVTRALPRARILKDTDDWPIVPGRNGRLEWRGPESDGTHRVYIHCRPTRVAAIPGVQRHQIGDNEAVFWLRADDTKALQAVAALLRLRYKRVLTPEQRLAPPPRTSRGPQASRETRPQERQKAVLATRTLRGSSGHDPAQAAARLDP